MCVRCSGHSIARTHKNRKRKALTKTSPVTRFNSTANLTCQRCCGGGKKIQKRKYIRLRVGIGRYRSKRGSKDDHYPYHTSHLQWIFHYVHTHAVTTRIYIWVSEFAYFQMCSQRGHEKIHTHTNSFTCTLASETLTLRLDMPRRQPHQDCPKNETTALSSPQSFAAKRRNHPTVYPYTRTLMDMVKARKWWLNFGGKTGKHCPKSLADDLQL